MNVLFIIGPSGSGKSELEKRLVKFDEFSKTVSITTRSPRVGEIDGEDYRFITEEECSKLSLIENNKFKGFTYGLTGDEFIANKINVIVIESNGLIQVVNHCLNNNISYKIIYMNLNEQDRLINLLNRDGNTTRKDDNISQSYESLYRSNNLFLPEITIHKLMDLDALANIVKTIYNIDLPQGPRKRDELTEASVESVTPKQTLVRAFKGALSRLSFRK